MVPITVPASYVWIPRNGKDADQPAAEHVAVPWRIRAIGADALAPGPVGRLRADTLRALEDLLRLVLDLDGR